jgi:hypothetical protein
MFIVREYVYVYVLARTWYRLPFSKLDARQTQPTPLRET